MTSDWTFENEAPADATPAVEAHDLDPEAMLQEFLYGGEDILTALTVNNVSVGVTTHRVLAFDQPNSDIRLQTALRPNVTGVTTRTEGTKDTAFRAVRYGGYGLILLGAGLLLDLGSIMDPIDAPNGLGIGQVINLLNAFIQFLDYLDDLFTLVGIGLLGVGLAYLGVYLKSRSRFLEIGVAGSDPIRIPITSDVAFQREQLVEAVEKTSNTSDD